MFAYLWTSPGSLLVQAQFANVVSFNTDENMTVSGNGTTDWTGCEIYNNLTGGHRILCLWESLSHLDSWGVERQLNGQHETELISLVLRRRKDKSV